MISFLNDYSTGCAKEVLDALTKTNDLYSVGYGEDEYTKNAIDTIRNLVNDNDAFVQFLVGGTQTNLSFLSRMLPYEAVIACDTGHIAVHETGAIEATGHKVITVPNHNSKIIPSEVERVMNEHYSFHMVIPKVLYISQSTEYGLVYSLEELKALREVCDKYNLYLYIDGARLSQALALGNISLEDIYNLSDAFYIGGTKNGLLFGEALVIRNKNLTANFKWTIKQRGALLAKGRLLGLQFDAFFKNDLYISLATQANFMADELRKIFKHHNIEIYNENKTNLIFVFLDDKLVKYLEQYVLFDEDIIVDGKKTYRFVTSYATNMKDITMFADIINEFCK